MKFLWVQFADNPTSSGRYINAQTIVAVEEASTPGWSAVYVEVNGGVRTYFVRDLPRPIVERLMQP